MDFLKDLSIDKVRNLAEDAFNQAKPKTEVEARVYEVLSHKNWGTSSTVMNEIARDTYDYDKFVIITQLMWEALENQRPAAWRVVFKGLTLLEHLVKNGSERCVDDARNHGHVMRQLGKFNYYEGTVDRGLGVREKSKQLMEILSDDERVREERQKARKLREKFGGNPGGVSNVSSGSTGGKYSGYGNDGWNTGASSSGGGYAEGGIDSERRTPGRYDNDQSARTSSLTQPTFAALPEKTTKSKKKKEPSLAPAPEVDLLAFDAPAPAITSHDDDFGDFQSTNNPSSSNAVFPSTGQGHVRPFAAFDDQPQGGSDDFGAFAGTTQPQVAQFDAFGVHSHSQQEANFGSFPSSTQAAQGDDDDFGDFAAAPSSTPVAAAPGDRLSKLISLDGLSKNTGYQQDVVNQPIVANAAAATYLQEKDQIEATVKKSAQSSLSFQGLDGIQKHSRTQVLAPVIPVGHNPTAMGGGAFSDDPFASISSHRSTSQMGGTGMHPHAQSGGIAMNEVNYATNGISGTNSQLLQRQQQQQGLYQGGNMGLMNGGFNGMHQPQQENFSMQLPQDYHGMQQSQQLGFSMQQSQGFNNMQQPPQQGFHTQQPHGFNNNGMGGF